MMNKIREAFCVSLPKKDERNSIVLTVWMLLWATTYVAATFIANEIADGGFGGESLWVLLAITVNGLIGIKVVLMYKQMLAQLDEMERKIQFDALAFTLGLVFVICGAGSVLDSGDMIDKFSPNSLIFVMSISYAVALVVGRIRMQ